MFFIFASLLWMLFGLLAFLCAWQAFHCPSAHRRKRLEEMGKPQMSPTSWFSLAGLCLLACSLAGCAMVMGPNFLDRMGLLGPHYDTMLFESPTSPQTVK